MAPAVRGVTGHLPRRFASLVSGRWVLAFVGYPRRPRVRKAQVGSFGTKVVGPIPATPTAASLSKCYLEERCAPKSSRGSSSAYGDGSGSSGPVDEPLEPANHVQVVGRGEPGEDVEDVRVRPHENTGLARLHTAVDDLRGLVGVCHRDRRELLDHLLARGATSFGVFLKAYVSHDVRVDPARMDIDRGHPGATQLVAQRIGEARTANFAAQ